jgi:EmrB/QacA subfamily drug resistance transporter
VNAGHRRDKSEHLPAAAPDGGAAAARDPRRWQALAVLLVAAAMDLVDLTIVNVALPSISFDLGAGSADARWIVAAYGLLFAVGLITGGRLGDVYGRRRVFLLGIAGFTLASIACGAAPTTEALIAARATQGLFAAVMVPQVLASIQVLFDHEERPKAYGLYGATIGLATIAAPILGAVVIEGDLLNLGWRAVFLINVPVGLAALWGAMRLMPESRSREPLPLDLPGVAIVTVALGLIAYPLVEGQALGWPAWTIASLVAGVAGLAVFALHQRAKERTAMPLVPPALFRQPGFSGGVLVSLMFFLGISGFSLVLMLTLQIGLGFSPLHAAAAFVPFSVGLILSSGASIQLVPRLGRRLILLGTATLAVGSAAVGVAAEAAGASITTWELLPGMLLSGLALGMVGPTIVNVALAEVRQRDIGAAAGVVSTTSQLGLAAGVALAGLIFFSLLPNGNQLGADPGSAYVDALADLVWFQIAVCAVTAALTALLPSRPPAPDLDPFAVTESTTAAQAAERSDPAQASAVLTTP